MHSQWNGDLPGTKPSKSEIQIRKEPALARKRLHVGGDRDQHRVSPIGEFRNLTQTIWF